MTSPDVTHPIPNPKEERAFIDEENSKTLAVLQSHAESMVGFLTLQPQELQAGKVGMPCHWPMPLNMAVTLLSRCNGKAMFCVAI